jgi:hypothetical protein
MFRDVRGEGEKGRRREGEKERRGEGREQENELTRSERKWESMEGRERGRAGK